MTNPFVFIVGCPRSGTTLLRRMVDAHPRVAIIPEIGWLARSYERRDGVDSAGNVEPSLVADLFSRGSMGRYSSLPVPLEELERRISDDAGLSYRDLVTLLFDRYGEHRGKPLVGNKTVDHALSLGTLHELFPEARMVHLIRDGRDVAMSAIDWRRAGKLADRFSTWRAEPIGTALCWWEWHVEMARQDGLPLGPDRYVEMRYEALVGDPRVELTRLCAFLGIEYSESMVHFHEGHLDSREVPDAKHRWLPATPGLRDWRRQMAPDAVETAEAVAGDLLTELGYPRAVASPSKSALRRAAQLRERFEGRPLPRKWIGAGART